MGGPLAAAGLGGLGQARCGWSETLQLFRHLREGLFSYNVVAELLAVVATTSGTSAADTESRAVSLDMSETLAVIALLGLGSAWERAFARLVI